MPKRTTPKNRIHRTVGAAAAVLLGLGVLWPGVTPEPEAKAANPALIWEFFAWNTIAEIPQFGAIIVSVFELFPFLNMIVDLSPDAPPRDKPSDAPVPQMFAIADCAMHKSAENQRTFKAVLTVEQMIEKTEADCQWATDADYGDDTWLAHDAFGWQGDGKDLVGVSHRWCLQATAGEVIRERGDNQCLGAFGINVGQDHYRFLVFADGKVQYAVDRRHAPDYPDYPLVSSSSGGVPPF